MAKRKLEFEVLTGYLHNVSTVSTSSNGKTKYFTGTIQLSKTDLKRLTSDKHDKFVSAASMNYPIKLT